MSIINSLFAVRMIGLNVPVYNFHVGCLRHAVTYNPSINSRNDFVPGAGLSGPPCPPGCNYLHVNCHACN